MPSAYYYFVATLPGLHAGAKPPWPVQAFLAHAEASLPPADYAVLEGVAANSPAALAAPAVRAWAEWDEALRRSQAFFRAARLGRDTAPYADDGRLDRHTRSLIQECVKDENPLAAEQALDQARWAFLDQLAATSAFDFTVVLAYLLKLRILERWQSFDAGKGETVLATSMSPTA